MENKSPTFYFSSIKTYAHAILFRRTTALVHFQSFILPFYQFFALHFNPFWIQLFYFTSLSLLGALALVTLNPSNPSFKPRYIDMLYMSTSGITVTGLATIDMEDLSSSQIITLALLMLLGGDVFMSLISLLLRKAIDNRDEINDTVSVELRPIDPLDAVERSDFFINSKELKYNAVRYLGYVILCYSVVIHIVGSLIVLCYIWMISSARDVLKRKGINVVLFSIFATVSSFSSGGLIPTNESMIVFKKNSGLLLLIIPQILAGNTLFPLFLRLVICGLKKLTKLGEFEDMMKDSQGMGFAKLMPNMKTVILSLTVVGLMVIHALLFSSMHWNSSVFDGLNSYQKVVNTLFMVVNTRHGGEGSLDLSLVSPSALVLFVVMMYLPASTSFTLYTEEDDASPAMGEEKKKRKRFAVQKLMLSPLACVAMFIIAICITERRKLSVDHSTSVYRTSYGNVGLSMGYSCERQLHPISSCKNRLYSFSGWWSNEGKLILIVLMIYGRLKKFTMGNGKAWKLS